MVQEMQADIVIIGAGMGGTAAALAAVQSGKRVIMTEETAWIGGQLTSQAVPPDEHPWIESFGCTRSYRQLREGIRNYYRQHFPLTPEARANPVLNPGGGIVSRLCHEPRAALAVLHQILAPYIHSGQLIILHRHVLLSAECTGDRVLAIKVQHIDTLQERILTASFFLDATECGDLLPTAGIEYVTGAESIAQTGEPHALTGNAEPHSMQGITYCFAMDYIEGEQHTIAKPASYDFWRNYKPDFWPDRLFSLSGIQPSTLKRISYELFPGTPNFSLFLYRQIANQQLFSSGTYSSSISLVNWPQNDYWLGSIIDVSDEERSFHLQQAKQQSLSWLYWLQTEAPRPDGKQGYPGLRLRGDVVGTDDGLAMYPYIRESRRIRAEFTVLEQHVAAACRAEGYAQPFHDSIGIGCYRIDLHPSTGGHSYIDIASLPFQIPLGSLIPQRMTNVLAACKNIGVTHITNGCYRLHPVEWNIGEAAGHCASYCMDHGLTPSAVRNNQEELVNFQNRLIQAGIELSWPTMHAV